VDAEAEKLAQALAWEPRPRLFAPGIAGLLKAQQELMNEMVDMGLIKR
jgi:hypothetical protein